MRDTSMLTSDYHLRKERSAAIAACRRASNADAVFAARKGLRAGTASQAQCQPPSSMRDIIGALTCDLAELRSAGHKNGRAVLNRRLQRRAAPMLLLESEQLRAVGRLPSFSEVEAVLTSIEEVDPVRDRTVFVSHRWWQPGVVRAQCRKPPNQHPPHATSCTRTD